ncbi:MAG: deoxyhypusine synthase family protein [Cyanobacteria bacterium P01_H01_bin.15]
MMKQHFRHFNAATCLEAAEAWVQQLEKGNKMLLSMAGAMSTAELGVSLAEMIRQGKIHGICCTGANLEEDIFNLIAHKHYKRIPNYRYQTPDNDKALLAEGLNRVTDTCIPEEEAMRKLESRVLAIWQRAERTNERLFPYQVLYRLLASGALESEYQIDPTHSWVLAAYQKQLPIFTPGWEDSTLGNMFVAQTLKGTIQQIDTVKSGLEQMAYFVQWYQEHTQSQAMGFFQIGGGIAGDFPICVVPLIRQDLQTDCKLWSYFAQISDSTTSYGSYSGATPNEKISWNKLDVDTPTFVIESDATIVAPLIFNYVLDN